MTTFLILIFSEITSKTYAAHDSVKLSLLFARPLRALGVPIRYVGALSRCGDDASYDDVSHRWTEIYLPPYGWISFVANKGDRGEGTLPGQKVLGIGNVDARYIITTENGGGDRYLWFGYNYGFEWTSEGKCRIHEESYGLWSPRGEKKYHKPIK